MRNRFSQKKKRQLATGILMPVVLFLMILCLFLWGLAGLGKTSWEQRLSAVERAITQSAVQCYAIEGQYPPDIAYLEENYGLTVDHETYVVQYRAIGGNLMPDILVIPRSF
ncbi:hypothetical protein U6B65_08850 [Oscillospiraceae bacterium MB08-C2-2]|nr:hypothetical protein U6B65_08850 [Oscillospiraceae bacterium MB08-C2-2]